jgi:hypothetical protein
MRLLAGLKAESISDLLHLNLEFFDFFFDVEAARIGTYLELWII